MAVNAQIRSRAPACNSLIHWHRSGLSPDGVARVLRHADQLSYQQLLPAVIQEMVSRRLQGDIVKAADYLEAYPKLANRAGARAAILHEEFVGRNHRDPTYTFDAFCKEHQADVVALRDEHAFNGETICFGDQQRVEIKGLIDRGGFGLVYLGYQPELRRNVAVKVLAPSLGLESEKRFAKEGPIIASLDHPNLATVYFADQWNGHQVQVMEYVGGGNLRDLLSDGPLPAKVAAEIALEIARGIAHAHANNVLHRDLKPENVLLTLDGKIKVIDFGIARADNLEWTSSTMPGTQFGTVGYQSPEIARGDIATSQSDVYSLGVLLFELVTGRWPIGSRHESISLTELETSAPKSPLDFEANVPRDICKICNTALRKQPGNRYQDAGEFAADIEAFLDNRPVAGSSRVSPLSDRHPTAMLIFKTLSAFIALMLLAWGGTQYAQFRSSRFDAALTALSHRVNGMQFKPLEGEKVATIIKDEIERLERFGTQDSADLEKIRQAKDASIERLFQVYVQGYKDTGRIDRAQYRDAQAVISVIEEFDPDRAEDGFALLLDPTHWKTIIEPTETALPPTASVGDVSFQKLNFESPGNRDGIRVRFSTDLPPAGRSWSVHIDGAQPTGSPALLVDGIGAIVPLDNHRTGFYQPDTGKRNFVVGRESSQPIFFAIGPKSGQLIGYQNGAAWHHWGGGQAIQILPPGSGLLGLATSPSHEWLAIASQEPAGTFVYVCRTPTHDSLSMDFDIRSVAHRAPYPGSKAPKISDDGEVWTIDELGQCFRLLESSTWTRVPLPESNTHWNQIELASDDSFAAVTVTDGENRLISGNWKRPDSFKQIATSASRITTISVSPDNAVICWGESDGTVRYSSNGNGSIATKILGNFQHPVSGVSISSQNNLILATAANGDSHVWNLNRSDKRTGSICLGRSGFSVQVRCSKNGALQLHLYSNGRLVQTSELRPRHSRLQFELVRTGPRFQVFVDKNKIVDRDIWEHVAFLPNALLIAPNDVSIQDLTIDQRTNDSSSSLNAADNLYSQNDYSGALELYQRQLENSQRVGNRSEILQCRYLIGSCFEQLNRIDDALNEWESVRRRDGDATGSDQQLEALADFQRWKLLSASSGREAEAQSQFDVVKSKYSFGQEPGKMDVSSVITFWMQQSIVDNYSRFKAHNELLFTFDKRQLDVATVRSEVARFASPIFEEQFGRDLELFEAAWMAGPKYRWQLDEVVLRLKGGLERLLNPDMLAGNEQLVEAVIERCCWYDRIFDSPRTSMQRIVRIESLLPEFGKHWQQLRLELARCEAALGNRDTAKTILLDFVSGHGEADVSGDQRLLKYGYWAQAHLMLGFLEHDAGNTESAQKYWRAGTFNRWKKTGNVAQTLIDQPALPQACHILVSLLAEKPLLSNVWTSVSKTKFIQLLPKRVTSTMATVVATPEASRDWAVRMLPADWQVLYNRGKNLCRVALQPEFKRIARNYAFRTVGFDDLYRRPVAELAAICLEIDFQTIGGNLGKQERQLIQETMLEIIENAHELFTDQGKQDLIALAKRWFDLASSSSMEGDLAVFERMPQVQNRVRYLFALKGITKDDLELSKSIKATLKRVPDELLSQCIEIRDSEFDNLKSAKPDAQSK